MNARNINMHLLTDIWKQNFLDVACTLREKPRRSPPA